MVRKRILEPDLLVQQHGKQEADDEAEDQRQRAVDGKVADRDEPAVGAPQAFVLVEADEAQAVAEVSSR